MTLDDDIARALQRRARGLGKPLKEVVNATLRDGLAKEDLSLASKPASKVVPRNLGLKAGIDPDKLNQLVDELQAVDQTARHQIST